MSRIAELYSEQFLNPQRWVSKISFSCPVCGEGVHQEVDVPEPNYAADRTRDMVSEGETEIYCKGCDDYFYGDVWAGPMHCDITLRDHPDTNVYCDPPGYDRPPEDWYDDWIVPDDPVQVFKTNVEELNKLIESQAQADGSSLMNRMIFAQVLTFLEAYLCDTLISGLRLYPDRLADFAARDGSIAQTEFRASDILRDSEHVRKSVEHNLKSRLYHQFGSGKRDKKGREKPEGVPLWYAQAFGFDLTPTPEDLEKLRSYAAHRHDCVHRNGKTKNDETLKLFNVPYLREALSLADRVVDHIDKKMLELETKVKSSAYAALGEPF
ncbi:hypothetical protein [Leisingera daeponensis]|uniref:hypothetical protein n=1 Tax=Leisingera daeponensis TaxID=405746 RepID=UPI001C986998|nr:hypothetical protein [Leisingera daeponensis]MBY6057943.1 hypothetical protein [Leisingera daeponensis]